MKRKYVVLLLVLLVSLVMGLTGCGKKRRYVAPPPAPFAPFDLTATAISSEQIDLAWKDTSRDKKGSYIYRKDTNGFRKIAVLDPNGTSYTDSPLKPETTYRYKVTNYNDSGESSPSNETSATTPAEVEILDYSMEKYYDSWSKKWNTSIRGNVKNNTSRTLTIWIKGKFFSYRGWVVATEETYLNNIDPGKSSEFYLYHYGESEIERVEVWVEDYY